MDKADIYNDAYPLIAAAQQSIAVWGAGEHGQWLARQLGERCVGFIDSNPLKVGTTILGLPVTPPEAVDTVKAESIWIAVLSDAGSIAHELERHGRVQGSGYEIPFRRGKLLQIVNDWLPQAIAFLNGLQIEGRDVLEIGSGGRFFLAATLIHVGASRVEVTDAAPYATDALQREIPELQAYLDILRNRWPNRITADLGFEEVISRITVTPDAISSAKLPHAVKSVDIVANTGVMEHVAQPAATFKEIARILRPKGLALCLAIGIHDHRANARDGLFTPWSFLEETSWEERPENRYHQNRCRPADFRRMCATAGLRIVRDRTDIDHRLDTKDVDRFAPAFRTFSLLELRELNHWLAAEHG